MTLLSKPLRVLRALNLATLAMLAATVVLSAFLRQSLVGVGCEPWPQCYGAASVQHMAEAAAAPSGAVLAARLAHRVVASLALLSILGSTLIAWSLRGPDHGGRRLASALLALALALAALGVATPGATAPAVAMGNLLGGMLSLALAWRLHTALRAAGARQTGQQPAPPALARVRWLAAGLVALALATGALTSASLAGASCAGWGDCLATLGADDAGLAGMDPRAPPRFVAEAPHRHVAGGLMHALHRLAAVLAIGALVVMRWRMGRHAQAGVVALLGALQLALGVWMVWAGLPLPLALAHNAGAALLLAALCGRH